MGSDSEGSKKTQENDMRTYYWYPLLATIKFGRKEYTIDPRLREFRFIQYGKKMEFIPFNSIKGKKMIKKLRSVV